MIQRLHLEEAQQPSAYAISAARESGKYKSDQESESLASEFQSLLAQITGQIAAIPDQAMAVGLALAQTAAPEQQRNDREADFENDSGDQSDLLSEQETQTANFSVDNTPRHLKVQDKKDEDDVDTGDDKGSGAQDREGEVLVDDGSKAVCLQDEVVETVEQKLVQEVAETIVADADSAEDVQLFSQGPREDETEDVGIVADDTSDDQGIQLAKTEVDEEASIALKQTRVAVKQEKKDESSEEDDLAQSLVAVVESSERDSEIALKSKKNAHLDGKHKEITDDLTGGHKFDQASSGSDSSSRNQSQKHGSDQRRELQDMELGSRSQKLSDSLGKGVKSTKENQSAEVVETLATPTARSSDRASDGNSFQMTILRQSFDALRMNRGEERAARPQSNAVNATNASTETKSAQSDQASRSSKTLTRPQTAKMLERVEATLKEAARSRDGRTISLHLEPVNLGKVKVDVSLREGVLHARIAPENQQVMTALREHAHELQSSLRKLGLDVESVSVSVTSDSFEGEMNTGQQMSDGRSFQDERNKMPHERTQLAENTVGNELAQHTSAGAETRGSATRNELDHWVA
jgi:flagellar hook-length control protein FliK